GARRTADAFLRRLGDLNLVDPAGPVPYWDFDAPVSSLADKDSSAGAIAASGLLELSRLGPGSTRKATYANAAAKILFRLATSNYLAGTTEGEALLKHGTSNRPANNDNTGLVYGDYFFLEALLKLGRL